MLGSLIEQMFQGVFQYTRMEVRALRGGVTDREIERLTEKQDEALQLIERELSALREKLILSMRRTMGVASSEL